MAARVRDQVRRHFLLQPRSGAQDDRAKLWTRRQRRLDRRQGRQPECVCVLGEQGCRDRNDQVDRQGGRRCRRARQLHRTGRHRHTDSRSAQRGAHRLHAAEDPAREGRQAGRGGPPDRLPRQRASELRDRRVLRHLRRTSGLLIRIVRFGEPGNEPRLGLVEPDAPTTVAELESDDVLTVLRGSRDATGRTIEALDAETLELPPPFELLAPLVPPETWAAGVTYERSRDARVDESRVEARDVYSLVYDAERPELFMKDANGRRTVGPSASVGVRSDALWTVPEPELALVLDAEGELLGATIGNDVTARDVEGANPLYLPQAKLFAAACALGPAIALPDDWSQPFEIELRLIGPDGNAIYEARTSTARMRRSFEELSAWVVRENPVPAD